jgi:hypothetical protein
VLLLTCHMIEFQLHSVIRHQQMFKHPGDINVPVNDQFTVGSPEGTKGTQQGASGKTVSAQRSTVKSS